MEVCTICLKGYDLRESDATGFQSCMLYLLAMIYWTNDLVHSVSIFSWNWGSCVVLKAIMGKYVNSYSVKK